MKFVPWTTFALIVHCDGGNADVRTVSGAEQFRAMAFAQLT
jgi:Na+/citrate or Na+/malate symporter